MYTCTPVPDEARGVKSPRSGIRGLKWNSVPLQEQCMFLMEPFLKPSIYLFVCGGVVEVRVQFLGVGFLLHCVDSWGVNSGH